MKNNAKYYKAAGITVRVDSDLPIHENTFHPKFKLFEVDDPGDDNVMIHHHFSMPKNDEGVNSKAVTLYDKDQWRILKTDTTWIYHYTPKFPEDPGKPVTGIFNDNHTSAHIYSTHIDEDEYKHGNFPALTLFNTDQILFAKLLSHRDGLILHSNGFNIKGRGVLLAGASGSGKSTMSGMLKEHGFQIFCDDRMFIRRDGTGFRIYGSWCHGSSPDVSPGSLPLNLILFLRHSKLNKAVLIKNKKEAAQKLINSMVKPFLNPEGWISTIDILQDMAFRINCYEVFFDMSGKICEEIKAIVKKSK